MSVILGLPGESVTVYVYRRHHLGSMCGAMLHDHLSLSPAYLVRLMTFLLQAQDIPQAELGAARHCDRIRHK